MSMSFVQASAEDRQRFVRNYIEWQIRRNPSEEQDLRYAHEELHDKRYDLQQIQRVTEEKWSKLEIQVGLGELLRTGIKSYLMERKEAIKETTGNHSYISQGGLDLLALAAEQSFY